MWRRVVNLKPYFTHCSDSHGLFFQCVGCPAFGHEEHPSRVQLVPVSQRTDLFDVRLSCHHELEISLGQSGERLQG
jgi:hypothetical protein